MLGLPAITDRAAALVAALPAVITRYESIR